MKTINHQLDANPAAFVALGTWFAATMHNGQIRKFTGDPYILHPLEVAHIIAQAGGSARQIVKGLLHDTVEDKRTTLECLRDTFDHDIAHSTDVVSDKPGRNRAERKKASRDAVMAGGPDEKTTKLADFLSNGPSMLLHDREYALRVYFPEKRLLLPSLIGGIPSLVTQYEALLEANGC